MERLRLLLALALAIGGATNASAAQCSANETRTGDELFERAAESVECKEFAAVLPWSVMIWWSCDDEPCVAVMARLARELPDCEDEDGDNSRTALVASVATCGVDPLATDSGSGSSSWSSSGSGSSLNETIEAPTESATAFRS